MTPADHARLAARIDNLTAVIERLRDELHEYILERRREAPTKPDLAKPEARGKRGP